MKGICLCEAVTIETSDVNEFAACHCSMCQRWGGGPLLAVHCDSNITISDKGYVKTFESSAWAQRGFCSNCGTHLYYHLKPSNEFIIPVGLFQSESDFKFKEQIFIDKKPSFYEFSNKTENLTEQQVFEAHST
jgi:hypothetical protein